MIANIAIEKEGLEFVAYGDIVHGKIGNVWDIIVEKDNVSFEFDADGTLTEITIVTSSAKVTATELAEVLAFAQECLKGLQDANDSTL